ncbi:MAG: MmgE/PrpD family protein [Burkholderiales bacterium]
MSTKPSAVSALTLELTRYMAGALKRKLPAEVAERAKVHLVDSVAAIVSGTRLLPGERAVAFAKALGGPREAGVMGTRIVTSAMQAALANGMCGHADETDDTHPPTRAHPGTSIVPAVFAIGERNELPGEAILRAMVLGYDVCARVLLALDNIHLLKTGHHAGAKGGLFGSAAATAALLGLDARRMRYVLAYCAQQASGSYVMHRDSEHIEKAYVVGGMPAHNGVAAALMVSHGFTAVEDELSGEPNFLSIYAPDADREALTRGLGRDYEIMRGGIKYWPVGGPVQAPLHVLRDLMREHGFKAGDVEKLVVHMPDKELGIVNNRDMPDINVQHLLAVMLIDGNVTFRSAHDYARMRDARVLKLRKRIEARGDPSLTDPERRWRCAMAVTLQDGRTLAHKTMAAKGGVDSPLAREDEEEKALDLMEPVLGPKRSRALIAALLAIERIGNIRELRALYRA